MSDSKVKEMISLTLVFGGGNAKSIEVEGGITWKECRALCEEAGMTFPKDEFVVQQYGNKVQWTDETHLPSYSTGEVKAKIIVTVRPKETSGGAGLPYKEVRAKIKEIIDEVGEVAKQHFNIGKNYTTKGTEELNKLYDEWKPSKDNSKKESVIVSKQEITKVEEIEVTNSNVEFKTDVDNTLEQDLKYASILTTKLVEVQERIATRIKNSSIYLND